MQATLRDCSWGLADRLDSELQHVPPPILYGQLRHGSVLQGFQIRQWKHRQEEVAFCIAPKHCDRRGMRGDHEGLARACVWSVCSIDIDVEKTAPIVPSAVPLVARVGPHGVYLLGREG